MEQSPLAPNQTQTPPGARRTSQTVKRTLVKVPEIGAMFWIVKILTTALGESTSDFSANSLGVGIAVPIVLFLFVLSLRLQLRADRYRPWTYWFAVAMVAVFGTMGADGIHIGLGVPYYVSTAFYAVVLALIFFRWYRSEGTLSIHSIDTRRREVYYWLTVFCTFALGTAAGDMTATSMHWGFLTSGIVFGLVLVVPLILYLRTGLNRVFVFWFAYVFTRPLGASFSDWFGKPKRTSGINFGDGHTALILLALILAGVWYLAGTHRHPVAGGQVILQPQE
jgi:uncharacterized membrane-anchored protein